MRAAVARHLATEAVPARLGSVVLPYCLGLGALPDDSVPTDPEDALIEALRADGVEVQPVSTCELPFRSGRVSDATTGDRRVLLLISEAETGADDQAFIGAHYYFGPTASASWRCIIAERDGERAVSQCELISES